MADAGVSTESLAGADKMQGRARKIRLAFIGCGAISEAHLAAYKNIPEVDVVAGADIKSDRLDWLREKHGVEAVFLDYRKMLEKVKPDAVDVCTPNGVHASATIASLNAGAHVITEKPMAMNPRECQAMVAAARKNKRKLAVGFQYRYHPATQMIKRARDEGQFGNIMYVKCQALRRRGIPNWGVFGQKRLQGGGPLIDIGVHIIEAAHYIMGSPKPVAATGNIWTYMGNKPNNVSVSWPNWDWKTYTVEDLAIGHIRFANGAVMQIESSFAAHIEKDTFNFSLIGDKGGAMWDPPSIFTDHCGTMVNVRPAFLENSDWVSQFLDKQRNFIHAIIGNSPLEAPGEAGLAVQKIIDGVYRSHAAGKEVRIS